MSDYGSHDYPRAVDGVLDLRGWDFEVNGAVPLSGDWDFYWQRLYEPEDFERSEPQGARAGNVGLSDSPQLADGTAPLPASVPNSWQSVDLKDGELPGTGYATYRLAVLLDEPLEELAIRNMTVSTAFMLYVNGILANSAGVVGDGPEKSVPEYAPQVRPLPGASSETIEIVVQVSNFDYRTGGLSRPLRLGTEHDLSGEKWIRDLRGMFLFGTLFMISMYHFALFLMRRNDTYFLHLALVSLLISIRALVVGEYILTGIIPDIPFNALIRIEYISYFLAVVSATFLFRSMFPREFLRWVPYGVTGITAGFVGIVLFTPPVVFTHIILWHHAFAVCVLGYLASVSVRAVLRKRQGAVPAFLGFLIMAAATMHDILYASLVMPTDNIADAALIIFIFIQAVVLSLRLTDAFTQVETLTAQLAALNTGLEDQVRERTTELQSAYESIRDLSVRDPLTECYNRYFLDEHLPAEIERALRYERALSVVMCDIDHFKYTNDTYGHLAGDEVLAAVAHTIMRELRENVDWVCRYGGEEFVMVMPETGPDSARVVAERIRECIADTPIVSDDSSIAVTASFGVGGMTGKRLSSENLVDDLIGSADRMLYRAKFSGRNAVRVDSPLEAFEG